MRADDETIRGVLETMRAYVAANERGDVEAVLDLVVPDEGVVFIGSGGDEWNVGITALRSQIERDQGAASELSITLTEPAVSAHGDVAWLAAPTTIRASVDGEPVTLAGRTTAVLVRREERWLIAQSHFSLPAADQDEGRSFPE